jgi:hypothetical protein
MKKTQLFIIGTVIGGVLLTGPWAFAAGMRLAGMGTGAQESTTMGKASTTEGQVPQIMRKETGRTLLSFSPETPAGLDADNGFRGEQAAFILSPQETEPQLAQAMKGESDQPLLSFSPETPAGLDADNGFHGEQAAFLAKREAYDQQMAQAAGAETGYTSLSFSPMLAAGVNTDSGISAPVTAAVKTPGEIRSVDTYIIGKTLRNDKGNTLGKVTDVYVDRVSGQVAYLIVERGILRRQEFAVPYRAVNIDPRGDLTVAMNLGQFEMAPHMQQNMADRVWGRKVHQYFGVAPFWEE